MTRTRHFIFITWHNCNRIHPTPQAFLIRYIHRKISISATVFNILTCQLYRFHFMPLIDMIVVYSQFQSKINIFSMQTSKRINWPKSLFMRRTWLDMSKILWYFVTSIICQPPTLSSSKPWAVRFCTVTASSAAWEPWNYIHANKQEQTTIWSDFTKFTK